MKVDPKALLALVEKLQLADITQTDVALTPQEVRLVLAWRRIAVQSER